MEFDAKKMKDSCVEWIRGWFAAKGENCCAVLGMSGGKDSTVAAALCREALGADRVIGVSMPQNGQSLNEADEICRYLGIRYLNIPIGAVTDQFEALSQYIPGGKMSVQTVQNIPPRVRMTTLYAVAQTMGGMVANTCNLSEDYVGYATLFGDAAGSFSPLCHLVVREVLAIGHELGLPSKWVDKTPDDGLPHSSPDEVKLGFTYATLDAYIRDGILPDPATKERIDSLHRKNLFKTEILHFPAFDPGLPVYECE